MAPQESHQRLTQDLDALDPLVFQRLCNDLLRAGYGSGWKPREFKCGNRDRGFDASYEGVLGGAHRVWRVSVKHVSAGKGQKAVTALKAHPSGDAPLRCVDGDLESARQTQRGP